MPPGPTQDFISGRDGALLVFKEWRKTTYMLLFAHTQGGKHRGASSSWLLFFLTLLRLVRGMKVKVGIEQRFSASGS